MSLEVIVVALLELLEVIVVSLEVIVVALLELSRSNSSSTRSNSSSSDLLLLLRYVDRCRSKY